jgi:6-phosphogluconolactonase
MKKNRISILVAVTALLVLSIGSVAAAPRESQAASGAVYIMTNDPSGNQIVAYHRSADGGLTWAGTFSTGGIGLKGLTGTNQGGIALSQNGQWLIVVNAGSNTVSVFRVGLEGLELTDTASSQGITPISVTLNNGVVYVLNAGNTETAGNIAGFSLQDGELNAITGSVQPLSGPAAPAQISFNPTGTVLVVTEKSTSLIDTYTVNDEGVASGPVTHASSGGTPFGFGFDSKGRIYVSEAAGGPSGTSAVSSYDVSTNGALTTISGSVPDTQLAACWEVVTGNGHYTYAANAHSGTISSYTINHDGSVGLLNAVAANTGAGDLDMALNNNSHFLYVFVHGSNSIQGYSISQDGSLELVTTVTGVSATADGLAAN